MFNYFNSIWNNKIFYWVPCKSTSTYWFNSTWEFNTINRKNVIFIITIFITKFTWSICKCFIPNIFYIYTINGIRNYNFICTTINMIIVLSYSFCLTIELKTFSICWYSVINWNRISTITYLIMNCNFLVIKVFYYTIFTIIDI